MPEAGVIPDYLDALTRVLAFDRSLARCVRQEVEDHLREAVAADRSGDVLAAERRAVADFGDPRVLAAQFAAVALARQTRRTGIAAVLVVGGVFLAMKARLAWYSAALWTISEDMRAIAATVATIDRYAFWLSVIVATAGLVYIGACPVPPAFQSAYRRQLRRFSLLCTAATAALVVSVVGDGVLTALRLPAGEPSAAFLLPIVSMAFEIACAGILVFQTCRIIGRTEAAAATLRI